VGAECENDVAGPAFDFDRAYRENVTYVWRALQRLGARESELEDLAHDVFSLVYRKRESFDQRLPLRPWLFGIAYRVAADARRRAYRRSEIPAESMEVIDPAPAVSEVANTRQLCLDALGELSIEQRAVVVMHDLDGYTAPEIAESLAVPLNTVYSRLRLGRAKFVMRARGLRGEAQ